MFCCNTSLQYVWDRKQPPRSSLTWLHRLFSGPHPSIWRLSLAFFFFIHLIYLIFRNRSLGGIGNGLQAILIFDVPRIHGYRKWPDVCRITFPLCCANFPMKRTLGPHINRKWRNEEAALMQWSAFYTFCLPLSGF